MDLSQDFRDLLAAFAKHKVRYLLIGGYAVAFHARPRSTKDIDLWLDHAPSNLLAAASALRDFGAPDATASSLLRCSVDEIVWFGVPPARVDLLLQIPGVEFQPAYDRRVTGSWGSIEIQVICAADLITAKKASGRPQDLADADLLVRVLRDSET